MKEYSCFQAMFMSFYSSRLYRDVAKNWGAGVILYLFILLLISWGVMMFHYQPVITTSFTEGVNKFAPQFPEMTVKDGEISTPENRPYFITDPDNKEEVIAIIDTSGKYVDFSNAPKDAVILVTQTKTYFLDKSKNVKENTIPKNLTLDVSPEKIKHAVIKFVGWSWVLLLPALLLGSFAYRLLQALVYAIIGKFFAALSGVRLTYTEVLKLSMVAVTPSIVLGTLIDWFNLSFPFAWLVCFIVAMGYLIFAIRSNKNTINTIV
jgi:hypothetical protein